MVLRGVFQRRQRLTRRLKRLAEFAGLDATTIGSLSGHSMRVGAAQDLAADGYDLIALMTLGGWKTPHVVARYVEKARIRRVGR